MSAICPADSFRSAARLRRRILRLAPACLAALVAVSGLFAADGADRENERGKKEELDIRALTLRAERGDAEAQYRLGEAYASGTGVGRSNRAALGWWERAANRGHVKAQLILWRYYSSGVNTRPNHAMARKFLGMAARLGDAEAEFQYGMALAADDGNGVNADIPGAVAWFRRAAEKGHTEAMRRLGWHYANGAGVPKDESEAGKWLEKAAEKGGGDARNLLPPSSGRPAKRKSLAIGRSSADAIRSKAEAGSAAMRFTLGVLYAEGREGLETDHAEAARWFALAAEQGHAGAMWKLAECYAEGRGVDKNMEAAESWRRRAEARENDEDRRETVDE